jgi:hypothetical protein
MTIKRSLLHSIALGGLAAGSLAAFAQTAVAAPGAAAASPAAATVAFSGYDWDVKAPTTTWGPGPNWWSGDNVKVDDAGRLHLRITQRKGQWYCAEVTLDKELGYGTYSFSVDSSLGSLDPNVTLGMFTWSDDPAQNDREMDIEISRWGSATDPTNAQYVVQPAGPAGHLTRFTQPSTPPRSVQSFTWLPGEVDFATTTLGGAPIAHASYVGSDVPTPGSERVHINLWLYAGMAPTDGANVEVTLAGFAFLPATPTQIARAALAPAALFGSGMFGRPAGTVGSNETASAELGI